MNLLLGPSAHLPKAESLTQLSNSHSWRETQNRNYGLIAGQKLGILAEPRGEDHSVPRYDTKLPSHCLYILICVLNILSRLHNKT